LLFLPSDDVRGAWWESITKSTTTTPGGGNHEDISLGFSRVGAEVREVKGKSDKQGSGYRVSSWLCNDESCVRNIGTVALL